MNVKKKSTLYFVCQLIIIAACAFLIRTFIFSPITVLGISMEPTYSESDRVWKSSLIHPKRFDCITFSSPRNGKHIIKRVIGLPGDSVKMVDDQLFINDELVDEPYLDEFKQDVTDGLPLTADFSLDILSSGETTVVPDDHYFVLGDNRRVADDSRYFGFVDTNSITGTVFFRYYPLNKFGSL